MRFTLDNGKVVTIPDDEIKQSKNVLDISTKEAVEMWLDDNGYTTNEEQVELDEKAKEVKVNFVDAREVKAKKERKPVVKKVSDEKKMLFDSIVQQLDRCELVERENVTILNENKLIQVKIGNKTFKIDLIECRPPKKQAVSDQNSQKCSVKTVWRSIFARKCSVFSLDPAICTKNPGFFVIFTTCIILK